MKDKLLPTAAVERVIRAAGAHRVSATASEELAKLLEEYGIEVATRANRLAIHAKRTTVKGEDILEALEQME
ncbi:MAG: histone family protein [Methanosarcinales archaeon]|jgi:DNA-binding protein|nr:histone family protein [Methanosarcinales archaeon]MCD4798808.1 histone family protein [Methanosarcinales archaeon]MCD4842300.1 histone family protein [Methanosarcinales archaeon]